MKSTLRACVSRESCDRQCLFWRGITITIVWIRLTLILTLTASNSISTTWVSRQCRAYVLHPAQRLGAPDNACIPRVQWTLPDRSTTLPPGRTCPRCPVSSSAQNEDILLMTDTWRLKRCLIRIKQASKKSNWTVSLINVKTKSIKQGVNSQSQVRRLYIKVGRTIAQL